MVVLRGDLGDVVPGDFLKGLVFIPGRGDGDDGVEASDGVLIAGFAVDLDGLPLQVGAGFADDEGAVDAFHGHECDEADIAGGVECQEGDQAKYGDAELLCADDHNRQSRVRASPRSVSSPASVPSPPQQHDHRVGSSDVFSCGEGGVPGGEFADLDAVEFAAGGFEGLDHFGAADAGFVGDGQELGGGELGVFRGAVDADLEGEAGGLHFLADIVFEVGVGADVSGQAHVRAGAGPVAGALIEQAQVVVAFGLMLAGDLGEGGLEVFAGGGEAAGAVVDDAHGGVAVAGDGGVVAVLHFGQVAQGLGGVAELEGGHAGDKLGLFAGGAAVGGGGAGGLGVGGSVVGLAVEFDDFGVDLLVASAGKGAEEGQEGEQSPGGETVLEGFGDHDKLWVL